MLNLFKGNKLSKDVTEGKTMNEIIEEIHHSFFTEVDNLLASAKISNSLSTDKQVLINKCARLKALGFTKTKEVVEAEAEIKRLDDLKTANKEKETLIKAINYFSFKYPHYKFITESSVKEICEKYNLVYGEISKYIGDVPNVNLKHIEDFKISENDECYLHKVTHLDFMSSRVVREKFMDFKEYKSITSELNQMHFSWRETNEKCPLEIAAPLKDFNMDESEVKGFKISKIEIPDPVVLKPVIFEGQKHYLIITAWGLEASDEIVVNNKMN